MREHLADRLEFLRYLGDAGGWLLTSYVILRLLSALTPAATAVVTALLLSRAGSHSIVLPAAALGGILFAGQAMNSVEIVFRTVIAGRINGAHRARLAARVAATNTIEVLEKQDTQDLVRSATADPREWGEKTPAHGALTQLGLAVKLVGLTSSCVVVAAWSIWLVPVLAVPALGAHLITMHRWRTHYQIWVKGIAHSRRSFYWGEMAASPAEGKELRIFALTDWLIRRHQTHMHMHLDPVWADDRRAARIFGLHFLVTVLPLGAVFTIVANGAADDHRLVPTAAAVFAAAWGVFASTGGSEDAMDIEGARPVVRAARALRRTLPEPAIGVGGRSPRQRPPLVRFEGVSFRYPDAARPVLDRLDLEIRPGELIALVGTNGAGKSTLIKILTGLYRPAAGRVTADGTDITEIPCWRQDLAVVFQDFIRYPLSVVDNVALGQATGVVDAERLRSAARDAGLDAVVERLAAGWETPLSPSRKGGVDLSGGQWQQVALARALHAVRNGARLLVLDEPTAHLDVRTEHELFRRLNGLTDGVSTLLISHRLSTVRQADRIVLLDNGRITETGTHDELMDQGGRYAAMYRLQAERFTRGFDDRLEPGELV